MEHTQSGVLLRDSHHTNNDDDINDTWKEGRLIGLGWGAVLSVGMMSSVG